MIGMVGQPIHPLDPLILEAYLKQKIYSFSCHGCLLELLREHHTAELSGVTIPITAIDGKESKRLVLTCLANYINSTTRVGLQVN